MPWKALRRSAVALGDGADSSVSGSVLIRGDSRTVLKRLPKGSVSCVITSPPYGDQKDYGSPGEMGAGSLEQFRQELGEVFRDLFRVCKEGSAFWLVLDSIKRNGTDVPLPWEAAVLGREAGWSLQDSIVWDKGKNLPWSHSGHLRSVCEHILLFSKGKLAHFDLDSSRETDHLSSYWVKYPERYHPAGKAPSDLWHFPIPVQGSWSGKVVRHLCPFPVGLVGRMIALTTLPGDVVLDPFAGSGSVIAAAGHLGRHGIGIEFSREYFHAFGKEGARHLLQSAQEELRRSHIELGSSLSVLIPRLRANKLARTLFGQLSRPDRLPATVTKGIVAFVVKAGSTKGKNPQMVVNVTIVLRNTVGISKLKRAVVEVLSVPPLSKFGLQVTVTTVKLSSRSIKVVLESTKKWYLYTSGRFNSYRSALDCGEAASYLLHPPPRSRKAKVPPILSNLALRVDPSRAD